MDTEQLSAKFQKFKENFVANNKVNSSGLSEAGLMEQLQNFKNKCHEKDYIEGDLFLDEAYPGVIPTSFIVNVWAKKQWLDTISRGKALDFLIETLWETTPPEIRKNVFTLSMMTIENLTSQEIQRLFYHPDNSVRVKLIDFIETATLTEQEVQNIFDTQDGNIIKLLSKNKNAENIILNSKELKYKWLQWRL
ncbi:MAG: hypothetical protein Q8N30_01515 [Methylococcales bacterium]|nr:hypothetical protein [Methylococcales bacterium]